MIRKLLSNQKGQIVISFAFIFILSIFLLGLAIDVSILIFSREHLQNAVDMSVLAAVQKTVINHGQVESTANEYAKMNGVKTKNCRLIVSYPYKGDYNKVELTAIQTLDFFFLPVFGVDTTTISARAVAGVTFKTETAINDRVLDYAVFSGSSGVDLQIKGNGSVINGNVHGNKKITVSGANHTINGTISSVDGITLSTCKVNGTVINKTSSIPIPQFDFEGLAAKATRIFNSNTTLNNVTIDGILLFNGDLTLNGGNITGRGILLVRGSVNIPSNNVQYSSSEDLMAIYSLGNISLSCTRNNIQGVLYAPNGRISINGSYNTFYGALIANEVYWATKDITINGNYDARTPDAFTVQTTTFSLLE